MGAAPSACAALTEELEVVLEGLVSPQAADAWHAWGRGIPKEQVSWRGLLGAGEGQTDLWGCPVLVVEGDPLPVCPLTMGTWQEVGDEGPRRRAFRGLEEVEAACPRQRYSFLEMRNDHW